MVLNLKREEYNSGRIQPFRYTGAYHDDEANLYYLRARHYSLVLRRFLQRDPILFEGGINLYSYTACDFVNRGDWEGMMDVSIGLGGGINYHMFMVGLNIHYYPSISFKGRLSTITVYCGRLGPGVFLGGGGVEGTINVSPDSNVMCNQDCETLISIGIGGDVAFNIGIGESIGVSFSESGFSGIGLTGYLPYFPGWGIGFNMGIDICVIRVCKLK